MPRLLCKPATRARLLPPDAGQRTLPSLQGILGSLHLPGRCMAGAGAGPRLALYLKVDRALHGRERVHVLDLDLGAEARAARGPHGHIHVAPDGAVLPPQPRLSHQALARPAGARRTHAPPHVHMQTSACSSLCMSPAVLGRALRLSAPTEEAHCQGGAAHGALAAARRASARAARLHVAVSDAEEDHDAPQLGRVRGRLHPAPHVRLRHDLQQRHACRRRRRHLSRGARQFSQPPAPTCMQAAPLIATPNRQCKPHMRAPLQARASHTSAGYHHVVDEMGNEQGDWRPQATTLAQLLSFVSHDPLPGRSALHCSRHAAAARPYQRG